MVENKKQIVSLRMSSIDLNKVKNIARRLQVRESDLYRFAIKSALNKLAPFNNERMTGSDLAPVLIECGIELTNYFGMDSAQLEEIINGDTEDSGKMIDQDDIDLLAMSVNQERYAYMRLKELVDGKNDPMGVNELLQQHFYDKYIGNKASNTVMDCASDKGIDDGTRAN